MVRGILSCAAGLLALAAFSLPAAAEPSVISFVSGPLAGAAAEDVKHEEDNNLAERGTKVSESATFRSNGMLAWIQWSRLGGGHYVWRDDGLGELTDNIRKVFKATGATVLSGDRAGISGFNGQYRVVDLVGTPSRCGIFHLGRSQNSIIGFVCRRDGQAVPVLAVMQGLAVQGVIQP
jgi:hypothetical protein